MKTDDEIVFDYYLDVTTKQRNEAIELLKNRNFKELKQNYIHWYNKEEKSVQLKSVLVRNAIVELSNIKTKHNETEPFLSVYCKESGEGLYHESEGLIEIISHLYTIVPLGKCESLAKNYAHIALWKLKHQPNGKGAEACRKIISKATT